MKTIKYNTFWAIAGGGIPAIVALISVPVLIYQLGYDLFAITSLLISLTIFFYVYDFGIGRSLTFLSPQPESRTSITNYELVGSGIIISLLVGIAVSLVVYVCSPLVIEHWIPVKKSFVHTTKLAFQIVSLGIMPSILTNTLKGVLEGYSRFREANICKIFSGTSLFLAPLLLVSMGDINVLDISIGIVLTRYLTLGMYLSYLSKVIQLQLIKIRCRALKSIYRYSFWAAISGFISTMFVYGDRFVVAHYLNVQELSIYVASQDILIRYLLIPWSMAIVLMPIFSANIKTRDDIQHLYKELSKQTILLALIFLLIVMIFVNILIPSFGYHGWSAMASNVAVIQAIGVFFCALSQLPLVYLYANGKPRLVASIFLVEGGLYLISVPWIFEEFGLAGACVVWTARLVIEFVLLRYFAGRLLSATE